MATRRIYNDEDRARAYVAWITNNQVMKATVRATGIPQTTLRKWISEWEENGPPESQIEQIAEIATDFVKEATRVRDKALAELEKKVGIAKPNELTTMVGVLTDKINMARGLATSRTEHVQALPPVEEVAKTLSAALRQALQAAKERDEDIVDVEVAALPPAK